MPGVEAAPGTGLQAQAHVGALGPFAGRGQRHQDGAPLPGAGRQPARHGRPHRHGRSYERHVEPVEGGSDHIGPGRTGRRDQRQVVEVDPELGGRHHPRVGQPHRRAPRAGGRGGGEQGQRQRGGPADAAPVVARPAAVGVDQKDGPPEQAAARQQGGEGGDGGERLLPAHRHGPGPGGERGRQGRPGGDRGAGGRLGHRTPP